MRGKWLIAPPVANRLLLLISALNRYAMGAVNRTQRQKDG